MFTGKQLAAFCEAVYKAAWVYWYGTYGKRCTEPLYESKKKQYPKHYTDDRAAGYQKDIREKKWCADCVGLIKAFFWKGGDLTAEPKYATNHCPDVSANGMIALCAETGPIRTMPDIPGLVVWKNGHIGVYVGGGYTVEMKGFNYDCRRTKVKDGPWVKWGRLPASMICYDTQPSPSGEGGRRPDEVVSHSAFPSGEGGASAPDEVPAAAGSSSTVGDRDLRNGDDGADVKQLQRDLIKLGFSCGAYGADGEFGDCTEQAVEAFQRAHGIPDTGVYDAATREAMEAALDALDTPADNPRWVEIVGGNCYVRTAPNTGGRKLGVAHRGDKLPYQGQMSADGWKLVEFKGCNGWVSGKYSRLLE